jgi:predicted nucleic acid-binding protein
LEKNRTSGYYLDSSTLIHAVDKDAEYHKECLGIINRAAKGQIKAATSLETLEETLFILSKLTSPATALRVTNDYLRMSKIKKIGLSVPIFEHALEILEMTRIKRPKDAINVATMLEDGIFSIISEDKEYDCVRSIQRIHPKDV